MGRSHVSAAVGPVAVNTGVQTAPGHPAKAARGSGRRSGIARSGGNSTPDFLGPPDGFPHHFTHPPWWTRLTLVSPLSPGLWVHSEGPGPPTLLWGCAARLSSRWLHPGLLDRCPGSRVLEWGEARHSLSTMGAPVQDGSSPVRCGCCAKAKPSSSHLALLLPRVYPLTGQPAVGLQTMACLFAVAGEACTGPWHSHQSSMIKSIREGICANKEAGAGAWPAAGVGGSGRWPQTPPSSARPSPPSAGLAYPTRPPAPPRGCLESSCSVVDEPSGRSWHPPTHLPNPIPGALAAAGSVSSPSALPSRSFVRR